MKKQLIGATVYALFMYCLVAALDVEATSRLTEEDNVVEYLASIGFAVTSILFFMIFLRVRKLPEHTTLYKASYLVLALVFLFGAGEEISWGQRIVGIETPDAFAERNYQGEITLHNLEVFDGEGAVDITDFFNLFWLSFTLLIPVSASIFPRLDAFYRKLMPVAPWQFGLLFFGNWLVSKLGGYIYRQGVDVSYVVHDMVETKESNFGILFAVLAMYFYVATRPTDEKAVSGEYGEGFSRLGSPAATL